MRGSNVVRFFMALSVAGSPAAAGYPLGSDIETRGAGSSFVAPGRPGNTLAQNLGACHASYSPVCIPMSGGDVDCEGGGGDGPRYVQGPVDVAEPDEYGLDRDGNGIGCEPTDFPDE